MSLLLFYFLLSTISYSTVWVKGNSPPPLVAVKSLPPPPPRAAAAAAPPKWPYHVNFSAGVEGVVFCASCSKLPGFIKSINAAPLHGADVKLLCFERPLEQMEKDHPIWKREKSVKLEKSVKTDEKGYFLIRVAKMKFSLIKKCRVFVFPPNWCSKRVFPSTNNGEGIIPKFEKVVHFGAEEVHLYTAGFFEFEPNKTNLCPH